MGRPQEDVKRIGRKLSPWRLTGAREEEASARSSIKQAGNTRCRPLPVELTFHWGVREKGQMCKEPSRSVPDEDHEENKSGM